MPLLLGSVLLLAIWHSSPDVATAAARAERKILVVHYRATCGTCNDGADRTMESAAADPVFQQAAESFVLLRVTAGYPAAEAYSMFLRRGEPVLAFYAPGGVLLHSIRNPDRGWPAIAEEVLAIANAREAAAQATELRAAGDLAGAELTFGIALMAAKQRGRAARRFDRAAEGYRAAKDGESEQLARVYAGFAWVLAGEERRGRAMIDKVRRDPASPTVAAEAHLAMGELYETEARDITAKRAPGNHRRYFSDALESYRKAYDAAPEGSPLVERARRAVARLDASPLPPKGIATPTIGIVPPPRTTTTGTAEFLAWANAHVVRVEFLLDEKRVATVREKPFRAAFDVGTTPRVRVVKAIGYDAEGRAVGEAATTINDRLDAFLLNIVSPVGPVVSGKVEAELDAKFAAGRKLARLEVSWNGRPVAVTDTTPYRATFEVKPGEFGFLRALGVLDDGTTAEAVRVYNAGGVSESVEVANVIVLASVTDDHGNRVPNLQSNDFVVFDENQRVAPVLRSSDDDPVTIGIAVDSSSSMRGRQVHMLRAAAELIETAMRPQDQAFVVSFDSTPRLVHDRSSNAASLRDSLLRLLPAGGTSIFDGVTFALQQLQGLPGKKVLIVFSDGEEGASGASSAECERLARSVGVPVYVVMPPGGHRFRNALNDIVAATGGLMLNASPDAAELTATIAKLAEETRGQYVLSYTRPPNVEQGSWRKIRLTVERKNVRTRTIEGYRAW